jgi:GT2 family glycosyltransferase
MSTLLIAVVLTCHNRREKTLACLRSVANQAWQNTPASTSGQNPPRGSEPARTIKIFLTDDGSTDGTSTAVQSLCPEAAIISGDGSLFWCGGMRVAWAEAAKVEPDYFLLVNDDTVLYPDAIKSLIDLAGTPESHTIAVGAIRHPADGSWTYGGVESDYPFPMPDGSPRPCRTLNMNAALVSRAVFKRLGILHSAYRHAMGDLDYGLKATRAGVPILETPRFVGECATNSVSGTWRDTSLSRMTRLRKLGHAKGLPPRDWLVYTRRNCGVLWWRYFLSPYIRILLGR